MHRRGAHDAGAGGLSGAVPVRTPTAPGRNVDVRMTPTRRGTPRVIMMGELFILDITMCAIPWCRLEALG